MNIYGNEKADENAKFALRLKIVYHEVITSLSFLKRKVNIIIIIIIILQIEKHMESKTMVLYPPCY